MSEQLQQDLGWTKNDQQQGHVPQDAGARLEFGERMYNLGFREGLEAAYKAVASSPVLTRERVDALIAAGRDEPPFIPTHLAPDTAPGCECSSCYAVQRYAYYIGTCCPRGYSHSATCICGATTARPELVSSLTVLGPPQTQEALTPLPVK